MELIIQNNIRIGELQKKFNAFFPYLHLEFFYPSEHKEKIFMEENRVKDKDKTLGDIRTMDDPGFIQVLRYHTTGRLEQIFKDEYGIYAQVFRKSGNQWLETVTSDQWTLAKQNRKGKGESKEMTSTLFNEEDYHEQL